MTEVDLPDIDPATPPERHSAQLQALHALVLERIQPRSSAEDIKAVATELARLVGTWTRGWNPPSGPRGDRVDDDADRWLSWHIGHVESLLALLRSSLLQRLPTAAEKLLQRKHVPALLRHLTREERRLSDLAGAIGQDLSYTQRIVGLMATAQLVRTSKEGLTRWVSLTPLGFAALERAKTRWAISTLRTARALERVEKTVAELFERQERMIRDLTAMTAAAPRGEALAAADAFELVDDGGVEPVILAPDGRTAASAAAEPAPPTDPGELRGRFFSDAPAARPRSSS